MTSTDTLDLDLDLDSLLNLEDSFYDEGYAQGHRDGLRQSAFESRVFGVEQGFQKAIVMGRLHARARFWSARIRQQQKPALQTVEGEMDRAGDAEELPALKANERLQRNIENLLVYTESTTLPPANTDDDVADYDFRLRKALDIVKIIERTIGERDQDDIQTNNTANDIENPKLKIAEF